MAGKKNYSVNIGVTADLQAKNLNALSNQIKALQKDFDFGPKVNASFESIQKKVEGLDKIFKRASSKKFFSTSEINEVIKSSELLTQQSAKFQKILDEVSVQGFTRFNRRMIELTKSVNSEIQKINAEFSKATGGRILEEEQRKLPEYVKQAENLQKEIQRIEKEGFEKRYKQLRAEEDKKILERKNALAKITQMEKEAKEAYSKVWEERDLGEKEKKYFGDYFSLAHAANSPKMTKELAREKLGKQKQNELIKTTENQIDAVEKLIATKEDSLNKDREALKLAKQFNIESVKGAEELLKTLNDVLKTQKEMTLTDTKKLLSVEEVDNYQKVFNEKRAVAKAFDEETERLAREQEKNVFNSYGYTNKSQVQKEKKSLIFDSQTTNDDLIEQASEDVDKSLRTLNESLRAIILLITNIKDSSGKIATQTERGVDEGDLLNSFKAAGIDTEIDRVQGQKNTEKIKKEIKNPINMSLQDQEKEFIKSFSNSDFHGTSERAKKQVERIINATLKNVDKAIGDMNETDVHNMNQIFKDRIKGKLPKGEVEQALQIFTAKMHKGVMTAPGEVKKNAKLSNLTEQVDATNSALKKAAESTKFFGSALGELGNKLDYVISLNFLFDKFAQLVGDAIAQTKTMDKDLTQIGLVLGKTSGQIWKSFGTYSSMADRLNTTTSEVISSMKLFYQQGLNTSEVNKMVEASAIAAALGETDLAEASDTLTSIMNSYELSARDALAVTDKISQVSITSAADFREMSIAIQKVASSAASAGLDLDHMMGYLAKMIETTREAPTNLGTALKTIVANFAQFKEDPTKIKEEGSPINKVDKALKSVGIQLLNEQGEMRDLSKIIDELGSKWNGLDRNTKSYLATMIAGTRQQSRFYALMNNYDRTLELVTASTDSAGMAQRQFELYGSSLEAQTKRLTNEWQKFFNSMSQGNGALVVLTKGLTSLVKVVNVLGAPATAAGLIKLFTIFGKIKSEIGDLNEKIINETTSAADLKGVSAAGKQYIKGILESQKREKAKTFSTKKYDAFFDNLITKSEKLSKKWEEWRTKRKKDFNEISEKAKRDGLDAVIGENLDKISKKIKNLNIKIMSMKKNSSDFFTKEKFKGMGETIKNRSSQAFGWVKNKVGTGFQGIKNGVKNPASLAPKMLSGVQKGLRAPFKKIGVLLTAASGAFLKFKTVAIYALKGIAVGMKSVVASAGLVWLAVKALETIGKLASTIYEKMGASAEAFQKQREEAESKGSRIKELREEYEELNSKVIKTREERERLNEIISEATLLDSKLGKQLRANANNYQANVKAMKEYEAQQKKIAGEKMVQTELTKNNIINVLPQLASSFFETIGRWGDNLGENRRKEWKPSYDAIVVGKQDQYNLTGTERSLAMSYAENLHKFDPGKDPLLGGLREFSDKMDVFIKDMQGMDEDQKQKYQDLLDKRATGEMTYTQFLAELGELKLPEKISKLTAQDIHGREGDLFNKYGEQSLIANMKESTITALTEADLKTYSSDERKKYDEQVSKLFTFDFYKNNIAGKLSKGKEEGKNELEVIKEVIRENREQFFMLNDVLNNTSINFEVLNKQTVEAIDNFGKIGSLNIKDLHDGKVPQLSILKEALNGNIPLNKLTFSEGKIGVATKYLAERELEGIDNIINPLKQRLEKAYEQANWIPTKNRSEMQDVIKKEKDKKNFMQQFRLLYSSAEIDEQTKKVKKLEQAEANAYEQNQKYAKETIKNLDKQNEKLKELEKTLKKDAQLRKDYGVAFTNDLEIQGNMDALKGYRSALEIDPTTLDGYLQLKETLKNNPELMSALNAESEILELDKQKVEELARTEIEAAKVKIKSDLDTLETSLKLLEAEEIATDEWSEEQVDAMGEVIFGDDLLAKQQSISVASEAQNLGISTDNWISWSNDVINAIKSAAEAKRQFDEIAAGVRKGPVDVGHVVSSGVYNQKSIYDEFKSSDYDNKRKMLQEALNKKGAEKGGIETLKNKISNQITYLKGSLGTQDSLLKNLGSVLNGKKGGGGSQKEIEEYLAEFEKFFNILQRIAAVENQINNIRSKRDMISKLNEFYLDDLQKENALLKEQQRLYNELYHAQENELQRMKKDIVDRFSDYAYFSGDALQLKVFEIQSKGEKDIERTKEFEELVKEYEELFKAREESAEKTYSIEGELIENLLTLYDKYIEKIDIISEKINKLTEIKDFDIEMSFGEIEKFDLYAEKVDAISKSLMHYQSVLNGAKAQFKGLEKMFALKEFQKFYSYDDKIGKYVPNEKELEKLQGSDIALGGKNYNVTAVRDFVKELVVAGNKLNEIIQTSEEGLREAYSNLRAMVDERVSLISDFFSKANEEMTKFFDIYSGEMEKITQKEGLYGITEEGIHKQFELALVAAKQAKAAIEGLEPKLALVTKKLTENYSEYIHMVEGQVYFNSQAIENSTKLTDVQKAEFLQLKATYEGLNENLKLSEEQLETYTAKIVEMEKARKDALISITAKVKEALIAADQKEIDDLTEKYNKMTAIDDKYYSELAEKIQRAREARDSGAAEVTLAQSQARLALLKTDTSGNFTSEIQQLQKDINQQLQALSDKAIDEELKRLEDEQKQREEDRNLQIRQLEEQMNFRIENGIYNEMANAVVAEGNSAIISTILAGQNSYDLTEIEKQQQLQELNDEITTALTKLDGKLDILNEDKPFEQQVQELLNSEGIPINDLGILSSMDDMMAEMYEFNSTLKSIFDLLDKVLVEKNAGSADTGISNPTAPSVTPPPPPPRPTPPPTPATPSTPVRQSLTVGSYAEIKPGSKWYRDSYGGGIPGTAHSGTISNIVKPKNGRTHLYHIKSNRGSGWVAKSAFVGYSKGGLVSDTGLAMLHGTNGSPERVLSAKQTKAFERLVATLTQPNAIGGLGANISQTTNIDKINVNVEQIATNEQVDNMINKVKKEIVNTANSKTQFSIGGRR